MTLSPTDKRRRVFWFLTILLVLAGIEFGARLLEWVDNAAARRKNPFVESVNPVPAFEIKDVGGIKCVVRTGFHPLMNPELPPFTLERPKGGLRVFVLGGSAAAGWPYHVGDTNISALLERKLQMLYPGRKIEVINIAAGTYASHRVKLILDEVLHYNPDIIFLYNGNNEFLENLVFRPRIHSPSRSQRLRSTGKTRASSRCSSSITVSTSKRWLQLRIQPGYRYSSLLVL